METILMKALQLIVALSILIAVHEFGHYIFARMFGVRVNRFYLFMNPWFSLLKYYPDKGKIELIAWTSKQKTNEGGNEVTTEKPHALVTINLGKPKLKKKHKTSWRDTMYGIGWLPLGGYCDIAGMIDETKGADQLSSEPQAWEFRSKAAWKRLLVMVAGVLFNFLLAIVIYIGIAAHWGDKVVPYQNAYEGLDFIPAMNEAGFKNGDMLLSVNGKTADATDDKLIWDMVQPGARVQLLRNHADTVDITVPASLLPKLADQRSGILAVRFPVLIQSVVKGEAAAKAGIAEGARILKIGNDSTPSLSEFYPALEANKGKTVKMTVLRDDKEIVLPVTLSDAGKIGVQLNIDPEKVFEVQTIDYNLITAIPRGIKLGVDKLTTYVSSLKMLFSKEGAQQLGGFGTIGSLFPEKWNWYYFWQITAFLSVILAFMNIIPIPGLDGGHMLFTLWEMITRRKPSDRFLEIANTIGIGFLFLLLVYANGNDILRFFIK